MSDVSDSKRWDKAIAEQDFMRAAKALAELVRAGIEGHRFGAFENTFADALANYDHARNQLLEKL